MEWMNRAAPRSAQPAGTTVAPSAGTGAPAPHHNGQHTKKKPGLSPMRIVGIFIIAAAALVVLGAIYLVAFDKPSQEAESIEKNKMQAVFLSGGQVYFGKVKELNRSYMSMSDIYYLRVNQQVQPKQGETQSAQDISLVKLGCELHGPEDKMLINREQVIFWENLKTDGQVAKAVDAYVKANPDGQKCESNNQQTDNSSTPTSTTPATNTNTNTNNANTNSNNNSNNSNR